LSSSGHAGDRFLPPDRRVEAPYRFTPKIALRVGVLGVLAIAVFAVLFLRLWALQVLSGTHYLRAAENNQLRTLRVEAPRGPIIDDKGRTLVSNVPGTIVRIRPADLPKPKGQRRRELNRLASVLGTPVAEIRVAIRQLAGDPITPVTIKSGVHPDQAAYIYEHLNDFRGVDVHSTYLRHYTYQALAAHVFGHVGEITAAQLKDPLYKKGGYRLGDRIGQGGIEQVYDRYLRGRPGLAQIRVDASGKPRSEPSARVQPQAGQTLRLTIDVPLQQAAERAIKYGVSLAHQNGCVGCWASDGGAIVALDPSNGAIRALASYPTFKPSLFVGRVDEKKLVAAGLAGLTAPKQDNYPGLNRAIDGVYPTGSAFKPITALAAMQEHVMQPYNTLQCTPSYTVAHHTFKNWDPTVNQPMTLPQALEASCDTYFYQLGYAFYKLPPNRGHPLQAWAAKFGIGRSTGIDLPGEATGLLPTPEWRKAYYTKKTDPLSWRVDRIWKPGDSIQLAIGQKDLEVTPLQLTRVYALIANGGKLVTPHLAEDVEQSVNGGTPTVLRRFTPPTPRDVGVDPYALSVVQNGLFLATHGANGTATSVFGNFPVPIAGKTGTAEKAVVLPHSKIATLVSQSWWCGYGPIQDPKLVVCALIENGGHGGQAAAPAALKVFQKFFGKTNGFSIPGATD